MAAIVGHRRPIASKPLQAKSKREKDESGAPYGVVSCANFNAPGQIVIAGARARAVARASARVARGRGQGHPAEGERALPLRADEARRAVVGAELEKVDVKPLAFPVVANVDARPNTEPTRVKELLVRQVDGAVRWEQAVRLMQLEGITHAIEIGPGKVLAGPRQAHRARK